MRDECNAQDEAEKWLRAYAPQYLANDPVVARREDAPPQQ
jgi:hypothetical protein